MTGFRVVYIVCPTPQAPFLCVSLHMCMCVWMSGERSKVRSPKVTRGGNETGGPLWRALHGALLGRRV